jgi:hypothetical protein
MILNIGGIRENNSKHTHGFLFFSRVGFVTWSHIFATRTVRCRNCLVEKGRKRHEKSCAILHREYP